MADLIYLAYGSNLHPVRLRERVPSCELLGPVPLAGYRLVFHKTGMDGSGKCDLSETGSPGDLAWGVLYRIDDRDKPALDAAEGPGYACCRLPVMFEGKRIEAMTYLARSERQDPAMVPYNWYRELVLLGARLHDFPDDYIAYIQQVPVSDDVDPQRDRRHRELIAAMREE